MFLTDILTRSVATLSDDTGLSCGNEWTPCDDWIPSEVSQRILGLPRDESVSSSFFRQPWRRGRSNLIMTEAGCDSLSLMPRVKDRRSAALAQDSLNLNADVLLWLREPDKAKSQTLPRELPDVVEILHETTTLANLISKLPEKRRYVMCEAPNSVLGL